MNHVPAEVRHHLRVVAAALAAAGVTILALMLLLESAASGSPSDPNAGHKVTICHANSGVKGFTNPTVDVAAGGLKGGHHDHDGDIIPPFTYVDRDDRVIQYPGKNMTTDYDGTSGAELLANGCAAPDPDPDPDPVDACPNIEGVQETVPDGLVIDDAGNCVQGDDPDGPIDVCDNLDGVQELIPDGMTLDENGDCVTPDDLDEPTDLCPNLDGTQEALPEGLVLVNGACVEEGTEDDEDGPGDEDGPAPGGDAPAPTNAPDTTGDPDTTEAPDADTPVAGDAQAPTTGGGDEVPAGPDEFVAQPTGETIPQGTELPFTGTEEGLLLALGFGLVAGGITLEVAYRRRRRAARR